MSSYNSSRGAQFYLAKLPGGKAATLCVVFVVIMALSLIACGQKHPQTPMKRTKAELTDLLATIEPWYESTQYSQKSWNHTIEVARDFQASDPKDVRLAIKDFCFMSSKDINTYLRELSKPLILVRVMFDFQQATSSNSSVRCFRNKYSSTTMLPVSWPVGWTNGVPFIMDPNYGYSGSQYDVTEDYDDFRSRYPLRDLSAENKSHP